MQDHLIVLIADRRKKPRLVGAGISQKRERLIGVAGHNHLIKLLCSALGIDRDAVWIALHCRDRRSGAQLDTCGPQVALKSGDILDRTARNRIPLVWLCGGEQRVIGEEADKRLCGKSADVLRGA